MQEKIFHTFIVKEGDLERKIENWLKDNNLKEIDRSAPALTALYSNSAMHYIIVAVTVTAEKNN